MIYVDNMYMPAKIGRYNTTWCHMITDGPDIEELHKFAESIGLKRQYFQDKRYGPNDPGRPHYDVTPSIRKKAVERGAKEIDLLDVPDILARARGEEL